MRWPAALLSASLVALCGGNFALADPGGTYDTPEPKGTAQKLIVGSPAPFTGTIVDTLELARTAAKAEKCDARVDLARQEEQVLKKTDVDYEKRMREADQEAFDQKIDIYEKALEDVRPDWYEHPALWFVFGMALTGAVIWTSVEIIDRTRPQVVTVPVPR